MMPSAIPRRMHAVFHFLPTAPQPPSSAAESSAARSSAAQSSAARSSTVGFLSARRQVSAWARKCTATARNALRHRHPRLPRITTRGWALLAFGAVSLPMFLLTSWHEFLLFAVASILIMVMCMMLTSRRIDADVDLEIDAPHVTVGEDVNLRLMLRASADAIRNSPGITLPVNGITHRIPLPPSSTDRNNRIDVTLNAPPRSRIGIGPASISHGDPFGFVRHERETSRSVTVHVHPRIVGLPPSPIGSMRDLDGCASGAIVDDDFEFHELRPYVPGDDLRGVHWLTSARTGNPMVRRYEATVRSVPVVRFLPSATDFSDREEFELAVSVFASIGAHCVRWHHMVFVGTHSDVTQASAVTPFLDLCSGIMPIDGQATALQRHPVFPVSPSAVSLRCHVVGSRHDVVALRRRCASSVETANAVMTVIVKVKRGAPAAIETHGRITVLTVGALDQLRRLWKAVA